MLNINISLIEIFKEIINYMNNFNNYIDKKLKIIQNNSVWIALDLLVDIFLTIVKKLPNDKWLSLLFNFT